MRNLVTTLAILLIISNLITKAQNTGKVVINTKMIERFNDVKVDEDYVTFNKLVEELSFDDMKSVYVAYYEDDININSKSEIYLAIKQRKIEPEDVAVKTEEDRELLSSME